MSKYKNIKTKIDGIRFDSQAEANRYVELKTDPDVLTLEVHPRFELLPSFKKDGKKIRATYYIADFDVVYKDGTREIIDVKGMETAAFRLKAKMFDFFYPDLTLVIEYV